MQKIISLFKRDYDGTRLVKDEVVPGAEWVFRGEGVATVKYDGTCCMIKDGVLYKRYDCKKGRKPPEGFIPAQDPDEKTGHWPGWVAVNRDNPEDKWYVEAAENMGVKTPPSLSGTVYPDLPDGTYELCGPKVQGNPEGFAYHVLIRHGKDVLEDAPRYFNDLKEYLSTGAIEGIVWHHPDGRMVKIKAKDFGIRRQEQPTAAHVKHT